MVVELLRPTDVVKVKKPLEIQIISMAVSGLYTVLKCGPKNIWNQKNRKIGKICELRLMIPILAWARLGRGVGGNFRNLRSDNSVKVPFFDIFWQYNRRLTCFDQI